MKKAALLVFLSSSAFLSGCVGLSEMNEMQTMMDDYTNNDFVSLNAEPLSLPIQGIWSGNMGPFLVTMKLQEDGNGEMCSSYAGTDNVSRLKYVDDVIYSQEGGRFTIMAHSPDSMILGSPYESSISNQFIEDSALIEASNYCQTYFNS